MITIYKTNTLANAAKYVTKQIGDWTKKNGSNLDVKCTLIVPDRASLEAERYLLRTIGGSFNVQVRTFRRLAADILPKYEYLSKQAGIMALGNIISNQRDNLTCFKKGVRTPGFVENVYDAISMMKYCRVAPETFNCALPRSVAGKAHDLALLYQAYVDYTRDRFIDSADKMDLLCEAIAQQDFSNETFFLYDFDNFSRQELAIVEQLILKSRDVTVACCFSDKKSDGRLYLNDIYSGVAEICRQNGIVPKEESAIAYVSDVAKQIGEHMFRYDETEPKETDAVQIYEADNRLAEVYSLACQVQNYVRSEKGGRYKDIYVVTSDVSKYANAIATVFEQFNIPYFCDRQYSLADHPYARFVVDYLTLCQNNARLDVVLNFVKNRLFNEGGEDVFLFENYCLKYNISHQFGGFDLGQNEKYFDRVEKFRQKFFRFYSANTPKPHSTVKEYVQFVRQLIDVCRLREKNVELAREQSRASCVGITELNFESKVTEQAADKFEGVLVQAEKILGDSYLGLDEFIKILGVGLSSVKISVIPVRNDCVIFANMAKSRKHDIKFLALLGANQGAMPIVKSDTKLLTDRNIRDLKNNNINLEPEIITENRRERFSLFQLLMEPTKLYVSYPTTDSDGSTLTPSPFVGELRRLFCIDGKTLETISLSNEIFTERQALAKLIQCNRLFKENVPNAKVPYYDALNVILGNMGERYLANKDSKSKFVSRGKELYLKKSETSVSQVTAFYACPYKFFFNYGLNVKPRPVAEMKASDLGNVLHEVLDRYISKDDLKENGVATAQFQADNWSESDEITAGRAEKIFGMVISKEEYGGIRKDQSMSGILAQLKSECIRMCKVVKSQIGESDFRPSYTLFDKPTEIEFNAARNNTVRVDFGEGSFELKGKVDRVDVCGNDFVVIDYKSSSGAAKYTEKDLYIGHKLQLLVYIKAVEQILKARQSGENYRPVGFYYFHMHDSFCDINDNEVYRWSGRTLDDIEVGCRLDNNLCNGRSDKLGLNAHENKEGELVFVKTGIFKRFLTSDQIKAQVEYALELIARAGRYMCGGYTAVSPYDGECKYCDYKCICDFGQNIYDDTPRKLDEDVNSAVFVCKSKEKYE